MPNCECGCGEVVPEGRRFVWTHNARLRGSRSATWRGGRNRLVSGYMSLHVWGHPHADKYGHALEHVVLASNALGKALPQGAQVHHVNGNRADNRPENLVVCENQAYHGLLHRRQRAFDACGDANAKRCSLCSRYDRQGDITITTHNVSYHRACKAAAERERKAKLGIGSNRNKNKACANGHIRTDENTIIDGRGRRKCMVCYRATIARYLAKKKLERAA